MGRLDNKVAVVSGGANGIGRAVCSRFVEEGAKVIIADVKEETGNEFVSEIGGAASFYKLDVRNKEEWAQLAAHTFALHGKFDILVNNAGILSTTNRQSIEHVDIDQWRAVQSVNVEGVFLGCQTAVLSMKEAGGSIINMSSVAGLIASPFQSLRSFQTSSSLRSFQRCGPTTYQVCGY